MRRRMAGAEGLELSTSGFGDRRSSQLSYAPSPNQRKPAFHTLWGALSSMAAGSAVIVAPEFAWKFAVVSHMGRLRGDPERSVLAVREHQKLSADAPDGHHSRITRQILERVTGIEPAQLAWKARTLPLSYTRAAPWLKQGIRCPARGPPRCHATA